MITINATGDTTLHTAGKYCPEDILVKVPEGGADPILQEKTVEPDRTQQVVTADDGYDALSSVTVKPIGEEYVIPEGTLDITENGTHAVAEYASVDVNVPIPDGYIQPSGTKTVNENGTHDVSEYANVTVAVPDEPPVLQEKTVTENGEVIPDEGYDGLSKVTVNVATGGGEDLNAVLAEQEELIAELQGILSGKMSANDSDLPEGYYRVDFIEFNGEQLVDTGLIGNQDTRIRTSFTWGSSTQNHVYGCASSDNTASITSYTNGSWRFGSKYATKNITKNSNTLPYSVYVDKTTIGVTGSVTAISDVNDFETIDTLLLGGARSSDGGLPGSGIIGRIFFFYVWNGDIQVMKLVPVSNGNKYRFWDEISKVFFDSMTDTPLEGGNL